MIVSAAMTKYWGRRIEAGALIFGGLTIGLVTLVLTVLISSVIARGKQRI